jgi:oxygen-independent coproporphyrinogen III oxidase
MNKSGIYLHIPFCKTKCIYCDFYSVTKRDDSIEKFVHCLIKEIKLNKKILQNSKFDTIFFGGGTPSVLTEKQVEKILSAINKYYNLDENIEITIECNPGEINYEKLKNFRQIGVNRLSIGFQSFNEKTLKFLGRLHSSDQSISTFNNARKAGFENINIDLIYDIPKQKLKDWKNDLFLGTSLEPEHISAYSLTVEKNTALHSMVKSKTVFMPSEELDKKMFLETISYLENKNFSHYEISNFSKKDKQCNHNLHYWRLDPYLAFGPGAHGFDGIKRWWNKKSIDYYIEKLENNFLPIESEEILSNKNSFNETIMNGLRLIEGANIKKLNSYLDADIITYLEPHMKKWPYIKINDKFLIIKKEGLLFADEIIADLFII